MSSTVMLQKATVSRPKILLLGKSGQVGGDIYPLLTDFSEVNAPERRTVDLVCPDSLRDCIRSFRPDVIVNAAAYTAVDKAESESEVATAINARAPAVLAQEAAESGALLVHYSTDYVFDGYKAGPYVESDPINPLNVYGKSKAAGEEEIRTAGCNHLIFRTSWVYSPRGSNFLLTILRLARERDELRIVDDQIGSPTSSQAIAEATVQILRLWFYQDPALAAKKCGTYHLTAAGAVSWFGFASEIVRQCSSAPLKVRQIVPIRSSEYPTAARRPMNSRLDCSRIEDIFGTTVPHWKDGLRSVFESVPFVVS